MFRVNKWFSTEERGKEGERVSVWMFPHWKQSIRMRWNSSWKEPRGNLFLSSLHFCHSDFVTAYHRSQLPPFHPLRISASSALHCLTAGWLLFPSQHPWSCRGSLTSSPRFSSPLCAPLLSSEEMISCRPCIIFGPMRELSPVYPVFFLIRSGLNRLKKRQMLNANCHSFTSWTSWWVETDHRHIERLESGRGRRVVEGRMIDVLPFLTCTIEQFHCTHRWSEVEMSVKPSSLNVVPLCLTFLHQSRLQLHRRFVEICIHKSVFCFFHVIFRD